MPWTAILLVILLIVFMVIFWYVAQQSRSEQKASLTAIVDVFTSGGHHVELAPPPSATSELEFVKFVVAYVANVAYVIAEDPPAIKAILVDLIEQATAKTYGYQWPGATTYREMLQRLATETDAAVASSHGSNRLTSERFRIKLINGKQYDYIWCDFSPRGRKEHIPHSAIYLIAKITQELSPEALELLHRGMCAFTVLASEYKLDMRSNQALAHLAIQQALSANS